MEIVLAVGIFAFSIVGVVFLLGNALQSSSDTQRDSALSSALQTTAGIIHTYSASKTSDVLYFDQHGSLVTNAKNAHFRFVLTSVGNAGTANPAKLEYWTVQTGTPPPNYPQTDHFLLSRLKK